MQKYTVNLLLLDRCKLLLILAFGLDEFGHANLREGSLAKGRTRGQRPGQWREQVRVM